MSKQWKIRWLMFILKHDGIPGGTLSDDMDLVELYCILVLSARVFKYIFSLRGTNAAVPFDLNISMEIAKQKVVDERHISVKKLKEIYNAYTFQWEDNEEIKDIY